MKRFPIYYPFLCAVLPVLALQVSNHDQAPIWASARLVVVLVAITAILMTIFVTSLGLVVGTFATAVVMILITVPMPVSFVLSAGICLVFTITAFFGVSDLLAPFVCNVASLAVLATLFTLALPSIERDIVRPHVAAPSDAGPDVYYLVLDSYAGRSLLEQRFGHDDSRFHATLTDLGFSVGECLSPDITTAPSLAATLNGGDIPASPDEDDLWQYVRHSAVRSRLEERGYRTVAFASGFVWSEIVDADEYLSPSLPFARLTDFEAGYLRVSGLDFLNWDRDLGLNHRDRALHVIQTLPQVAAEPGSKFVFAHIVPPHPPFVFALDGSLPDWAGMRNPDFHNGRPEYPLDVYNAAYRDQVAYLGAVLPGVLARVLENSSEPPVIILSGDHGPWYAETDAEARSVLCAVYAPDGIQVPLHPLRFFDFVLQP